MFDRSDVLWRDDAPTPAPKPARDDARTDDQTRQVTGRPGAPGPARTDDREAQDVPQSTAAHAAYHRSLARAATWKETHDRERASAERRVHEARDKQTAIDAPPHDPRTPLADWRLRQMERQEARQPIPEDRPEEWTEGLDRPLGKDGQAAFERAQARARQAAQERGHGPTPNEVKATHMQHARDDQAAWEARLAELRAERGPKPQAARADDRREPTPRAQVDALRDKPAPHAREAANEWQARQPDEVHEGTRRAHPAHGQERAESFTNRPPTRDPINVHSESGRYNRPSPAESADSTTNRPDVQEPTAPRERELTPEQREARDDDDRLRATQERHARMKQDAYREVVRDRDESRKNLHARQREQVLERRATRLEKQNGTGRAQPTGPARSTGNRRELATRDPDARQPRRRTITERKRAAIADVGMYRAVSYTDLSDKQFDGHPYATRRAVNSMIRDGLLEEHEAQGPNGHTFTVVTATPTGTDVAHRAAVAAGHVPEQQTWTGLVKPAELAHDTALYRAALDERAHIEADGGRVTRVRLDAELKQIVATATEKARAEGGDRAAHAAKIAAAHELGLYVANEQDVVYPDAQLEIEDADGVGGRVNVEIVSDHYHAAAITAKAAAGYALHGNSRSAAMKIGRALARETDAGRGGGSPQAGRDGSVEL